MRGLLYIYERVPCPVSLPSQRNERPQRGQTVCTAAEKGGWRENTGDSKQTRTSALDLGEMALPV